VVGLKVNSFLDVKASYNGTKIFTWALSYMNLIEMEKFIFFIHLLIMSAADVKI